MAVQQAAKKPVPKKDDRIHGTVLHKPDRRVNEIIRQHKKSDIINLFNIDCCMLFRVDQAHVQFDMFQNYRPYILFDGFIEGVFLPKKLGLLFPNRCDQLDFREDFPVPSKMTYMLSDTEIAVLAGNGLFNRDWSCQGRIINSVLEIPCRIDYYAVQRTPLTFIEVQDRLDIRTSTMQTGYKTLAAAFLPYASQKHNLEQRVALMEGAKFDPNESEIRRRGQYEGQPVGFNPSDGVPQMDQGASFVEVAQARIRERLNRQMHTGDVLGVKKQDGSKEKIVANNIAGAVRQVQERTAAEKERIKQDASQRGTQARISDIDAKLEDMAVRMIYAGASAIPVETPPIKAEPLVSGPAPDPGPETPDGSRAVPGDDPPDRVAHHDAKLHHAAADARNVAKDAAASIQKARSRQEKLAERRAAKAAAQAEQARIKAAMEKEAVTKDDVKAAGAVPVVSPGSKDGSGRPIRASASTSQGQLKDDILSGGVDIDKMFEDLGV